MKLNFSTTSNEPFHQRIAEQIRQQIESGGIKPGERLPSYTEMRAQFGIHTNTMEKVFARLEREGLIERQRGTGTFVTEKSKWKKYADKASSGIIGISGPGFGVASNSSYWMSLLEGMREAADRAHAQLLLLSHTSSAGWEKADGVLVCDASRNIVLRHVPPSLPCVSLMNLVPRMASVAADDYTAGRGLTEYLLELGHRRIAYLHGEREGITLQRHAGYRDAFYERNLARRVSWSREMEGPYYWGADFVQAGYDSMKEWLGENWNKLGCTAVIAHNDETALGVIKALNEAGLKVPQDVSVAGFDGTELSRHVTPPLTTMELPLKGIGEAATEMLIAQIQADAVNSEHHILPATLQARESTAPPST